MDTHKLQGRERERRDHHNHSTKHERLPPPPPPPSSTTSPSHDFSFTISLVPSPPPPPPSPPLSAAAAAAASLDLAPADDIFLHGHLLPLQYSLPSTHATIPTPTATAATTTTTTSQNNSGSNNVDSIEKPSKPKSLSSLFGLGKPKKASEEEAEKGKKDRRSSHHKVFDVARLLRKCMVEPIRVLMAGGDRERRRDLRRGQRPHSFSGHLNPREKDVYSWRRRRRPGGQASAPASMRTSPTNSGHLSATSLNMSSSDESTMEELQSAIQAAIAHCKNSIAAAKKG